MLKEYQTTQPVVYKTINNAITNNTLAHVYLLEVNKCEYYKNFTLALAKALLLEEDIQEQDKIIEDENYIELKIIEPDGQWIKKEQIDDLQSFCSKKAIIGDKKVYVIYDAELLNLSAANSLLKFLEEPENNIYGILVTKNINSMLKTIVSRCQLLSLIGQAEKHSLSREIFLTTGVEVEEEKLNLYVDKIVSFADSLELNNFMIICNEKKFWLDVFSNKEDYEVGLTMLILFYKDILNIKLNKDIEYYNDYSSHLKLLFKINTVEQLVKKINILDSYRSKVKYNINSNLLLDNLILDMKGGLS